jgi:hypothetical protein
VPESSEASGGLDVGRNYYWRIDEHTASEIITGHVWRFRIGEFLIVDDMESYDATTNLIGYTWEDTWVNGSGAEVFLTYNDPNHMRGPDSQSMQLDYDNPKSGSACDSSYIDANPADLGIGTDWTIGGVKSITLFWLGDPCNVIPTPTDYNAVRLWMELEDTSNNSYLAKYGDLGDWPGNIQVAEWHQWDISLEDFNSAGVNLSSVERVTIGIGGTAYTGQSRESEGTIWIDDIRVYPPRCFPERAHAVGNLNDDCDVGGFDLEIMANEWLKSGEWVEAIIPADPPEVWYRFDYGSDPTLVKNDGSWGSQYDIAISDPPEADEPVWTTDVAPVLDPCDPNHALDFDGEDDYLNVPNSPSTNFAGTENMTITTWIKGTAAAWTHLVVSAKVPEDIEDGADRHATGLGIGGSDGQFMYFWNNYEWWWDPGFMIEDEVWTFMAIAVEPTKATAYVYDGNDIGLAINEVEHGPLEDFDIGCWSVIAQDAGDAGYFDGVMDDVRLYNRTLTTGEVMGIAGVEGFVYLPLDSVADLVVGIQDPNDPNAPVDDQVDFRDYAILGDNWLTEWLWP